MLRPPWSYQDGIGFVLLEPDYCFVEERKWWEQLSKGPGLTAYECVSTQVLADSCVGAVMFALLICLGGKEVNGGCASAFAEKEKDRLVQFPFMSLGFLVTQEMC